MTEEILKGRGNEVLVSFNSGDTYVMGDGAELYERGTCKVQDGNVKDEADECEKRSVTYDGEGLPE